MHIFPAIDLKDGQCVRLVKGDFNTVHKVADDPLARARLFAQQGASHLHVVDLDGAKDGVRQNRPIIAALAKAFPGFVQTGGGLRTMEALADYDALGLDRLILGSIAYENPAFLRQAIDRFGDKIALSVDALHERVCVSGWQEETGEHYISFAQKCEAMGVKTLIFTDISKDGRLQGPNFSQLDALQEAVDCNIIASGGVTTPGDVARLRAMGLYGAIIGKGLYAGTITLAQAIEKKENE